MFYIPIPFASQLNYYNLMCLKMASFGRPSWNTGAIEPRRASERECDRWTETQNGKLWSSSRTIEIKTWGWTRRPLFWYDPPTEIDFWKRKSLSFVVDSSRWASGCWIDRGCRGFHVLVLGPWPPPTSIKGRLWHAMWSVHTAGQAGVKLLPPWLYWLTQFERGVGVCVGGGGGDVAITINPLILLCLTGAPGPRQTLETNKWKAIVRNWCTFIGHKKYINKSI